MAKMNVKDTEITVVQINNEDYLCLTDMIKAKDGDFFITDWLRNRNTLEYIGIWEKVYNPNFNYGEFATIKSQSGLNSFKISVKEFVARTNAISLQAKAGRYGGTDATPALKHSLEMLQKNAYKNADVLIISDFVMDTLPTDLVNSIEEEKNNNTCFYSWVIGSSGNQNTIKAFNHNWIYDTTNSNASRHLVEQLHEIKMR